MLNMGSTQPSRPATRQNPSSTRASLYAGVNTTRRSRFDARRDRRWGDWGILEFPTPLLWLDAACLAAVDDVFECPLPGAIDIWP